MRRPSPIEWDQPSTVDSPAEDVFGHELALVPHKKLVVFASMLSLANTLKPVPIRVIAVFEPFVDKQIGGSMIQTLAHQFTGCKTWWFPNCRVMALTLGHVRQERTGVYATVGDVKGSQKTERDNCRGSSLP